MTTSKTPRELSPDLNENPSKIPRRFDAWNPEKKKNTEKNYGTKCQTMPPFTCHFLSVYWSDLQHRCHNYE